MDLFNRIKGVFFNPKQTFQSLSEKPVWLDVLIVVLIAWTAYNYFVAPYQQKETIQMMENSVKFREKVGEEQYQKKIDAMKNPDPTQKAIQSFILTPALLVFGFFISGVLLFAFGRILSIHGKFRQVFALVIHVNIIDKVLGSALRLFLVFSKKSVFQTSTGLSAFFPKLEVMSTPYMILGLVDFFELWMFGVLGLGLASVFKIKTKQAMIISYSVWLLKSLLYLALGLLSKSVFGG